DREPVGVQRKAATPFDVAMIEPGRVVIGDRPIVVAIIGIHQSGLLDGKIHFGQRPKNPTYMLRRGIHDRDLSTPKLPTESDALEPNELQPIAPDRRPAMQDVMGLHV